MVEINHIAEEALCTRPFSTKYKGEVTYTELQLRKFGFIVEGAERKINHVIILENNVSSHVGVVSEVITTPDGTKETRFHPTHPKWIKAVSSEVPEPASPQAVI